MSRFLPQNKSQGHLRRYVVQELSLWVYGKENDNEVKGEGHQQDYGMRVYDPRLGKFLSVEWTQFAPQADNRTRFQIADHLKVSARIHTQVTADLDTRTTEKRIFSRHSIDRFGNKWRVTDQGISVSAQGNSSKKDMRVTGAYFARNGMEIGPPVDIQFDIEIKRTEMSCM